MVIFLLSLRLTDIPQFSLAKILMNTREACMNALMEATMNSGRRKRSGVVDRRYKEEKHFQKKKHKNATPKTLTLLPIHRNFQGRMATFELYRRSTIGMCLTETLDEMVQNGTLSPELAIQVLVQFDKSMTEALETKVKSKVSIKGHLHTYRFCDNVWTFILQDALLKNEDSQENVGRVKIVACDSKLLSQ
ncbi:unnamed protein product [Vicia faba]|uniref:Transcription initiation factor IIA subunit 2 n=2 Tax=Vicia TaxID=3904 RepID=A0AAV0YIZ0_VICFA|nr:unnamed protein product [Vicia faba]